MACCKQILGSSNQDPEGAKVNDKIEKQMKDEAMITKLLLLGAGESGKSTVANQMRLIHRKTYSDEERQDKVQIILGNLYSSIHDLVEGLEKLEISLANKELEEHLDIFQNPTLNGSITKKKVEIYKALWADAGIQEVYDRRNEIQVLDSCSYFIGMIDRITEPGYLPTDQDILRIRASTTGVIETSFEVDGSKFVLVDVGGQRSERKKWLHCFDDVTAVIFVSAISAFDQVLFEDNTTNRLQESLKLFRDICTSKWFTQTAIVLFLNKNDLFELKVKAGASIVTAFPEYEGKSSVDDQREYIKQTFTNVRDPVSKKKRDIFSHFTCATDTDQVAAVFDGIKRHLLKNALEAFKM